jgi:hypothetical protein
MAAKILTELFGDHGASIRRPLLQSRKQLGQRLFVGHDGIG